MKQETCITAIIYYRMVFQILKHIYYFFSFAVPSSASTTENNVKQCKQIYIKRSREMSLFFKHHSLIDGIALKVYFDDNYSSVLGLENQYFLIISASGSLIVIIAVVAIVSICIYRCTKRQRVLLFTHENVFLFKALKAILMYDWLQNSDANR